MDILQKFKETAFAPHIYASKLKQVSGRKFIGTLCSYVPEEIILAAGALEFRIMEPSKDISKAYSYVQSYCCNVVKSAIEQAVDGQLNFIDGIVFPNTCDSIQRLSDIWRLNVNTGFHLDLLMPTKLNTLSAEIYMGNVIKKFKTDLEDRLGVKISEQSLIQASKKCNKVRGFVKDIYEIRDKNPSKIKGSELYYILKSLMFIDKDEAIELLPQVLAKIEKRCQSDTEKKSYKRLILSGGFCLIPDIYDIIEESGGISVYDDLCTAARYFEEQTDIDPQDIYLSIAKRYLKRAVCPAKHYGLKDRGERLIKLVREKKADAVIFITMKFCDPHGFDYPYLKSILEKEGIRHIHIEIDNQTKADEQLKNRCAAFIESLS